MSDFVARDRDGTLHEMQVEELESVLGKLQSLTLEKDEMIKREIAISD